MRDISNKRLGSFCLECLWAFALNAVLLVVSLVLGIAAAVAIGYTIWLGDRTSITTRAKEIV